MITKATRHEIRTIVAADPHGITAHDKDEMAIPSYLHANPLIRWLMWRRYEVIARLLGARGTETVLEFGCGIGLFLPELNRCCARVIAIDRFPQYAQRMNTLRKLNVEFVDEITTVPDQSLDAIVAADVLEHIEDLPRYLSLFRRKLRASGRLIVSGPTENPLYKLGRLMAGFGDKGDYHHTNIDRLIVDINTQGFEPQRIVRLPLPLPPSLFKICEFLRTYD